MDYRILLFAVVPFLSVGTVSALDVLQNDNYTLTSHANRDVSVVVCGVTGTQTLTPTFTVTFSGTNKNPGYNDNHENYLLAPRTSIRWAGFEVAANELEGLLNTPPWLEQIFPSNASITNRNVSIQNSGSNRVWKYSYVVTSGTTLTTYSSTVTGPYAAGTIDPFRACESSYTLTANNAVYTSTATSKILRWTFADDPSRPFTLTADLTLPKDAADPRISYHLTARKPGYFSVAFVGAPRIAKAAQTVVPQNALGSASKQYNHVVCEADLMLPRAQIASPEGWSSALLVSSSESSFFGPDSVTARAPTRQDSRFGVMMQREDETNGSFVRPVVLAPLMGGAESLLTAGQQYHFSLRFVLRPGSWVEVYRYLAESAYGFLDRRDNTGTGSLNRTLERMMDYLVDRNGENNATWHEEQKYYDYTDSLSSFKMFSPIFGLSAAIVTDDEEFYEKRARSLLEFALSRSSNSLAFTPYETENNGQLSEQNRALGQSFLGSVQLTTLHKLLQKRNFVLGDFADRKTFASSDFAQLLAKYRRDGNPNDLAAAVTRARTKIEADPTEDNENYMDWLDIYEASATASNATSEDRIGFLKSALNGIYKWASQKVVLSPVVPNTNIVVDSGGLAPIHAHSSGRHRLWGFTKPLAYPAVEQLVPAWRVALTGLQSDGYRGEFWMNNHPACMRLAKLAATLNAETPVPDTFLRAIARWGMVGRFANYPGDNRSAPSLVIERPELAENPMWKMTHATINPAHAMEMTGAIIDFLVSYVYYHSDGAIDFPSLSMKPSAFRVRAYGGDAGNFYGDAGVRLWMPRGLATPNNPQIDYIAGYRPDANGKNTLYIAFVNQSSVTQSNIAVTLNELVDSGTHSARRWSNNGSPATVSVSNRQLPTFNMIGRGIMAFAINDVTLNTKLHQKLYDVNSPVLTGSSKASSSIDIGYIIIPAKPAKLDADGSIITPATPETHLPKKIEINGMLLTAGKGLTRAFIYADALPEYTISAKLQYSQQGNAMEKIDEIFPYEFSLPFEESQGALQCKMIIQYLQLPEREIRTACRTFTLQP